MSCGFRKKISPMIICGQGILHFGVLLNPRYLVTSRHLLCDSCDKFIEGKWYFSFSRIMMSFLLLGMFLSMCICRFHNVVTLSLGLVSAYFGTLLLLLLLLLLL